MDTVICIVLFSVMVLGFIAIIILKSYRQRKARKWRATHSHDINYQEVEIIDKEL